MLNSFPVVLFVATVLGLLAGLGVGGGSILIIWLTLAMHLPQETARSINMMFFLPTALISTCIKRKQGSLHFKKIFPAIITGSVSALLFNVLSRSIPAESLRVPFGILLLLTGIKEILYRPRKAK